MKDTKYCIEAASTLKREKNSRGPLKNGEQVTIKTKTRVWRAVVADVKPESPPKPKKRRTAVEKCATAMMVTSDVVLASCHRTKHHHTVHSHPCNTTKHHYTGHSHPSHNQAPLCRPLAPLSHNQAPPCQPLTPVTQPSTTMPATHTRHTTKHHHAGHLHPCHNQAPPYHPLNPVIQPSTVVLSTHTPVMQPSTITPFITLSYNHPMTPPSHMY